MRLCEFERGCVWDLHVSLDDKWDAYSNSMTITTLTQVLLEELFTFIAIFLLFHAFRPEVYSIRFDYVMIHL